jgi:maleylacetate reductase
MNHFIFESLPGLVVFGSGSLDQLPREVERLGAKRALVLSTPQQQALAENVAARLGERSAGIFPEAVMHVPVEVARRAHDEADRVGADCVIAAGGGSTIGLGKAIALHSSLPILAVPTTYAGSEMTPIYGLTEAGIKQTGRDQRVLPKTVIYDPLLTLDLPLSVSVTSGFNAIAHAVEALYAEQANPVTAMMAEEGIRALSRGMPLLASDPRDLDGRSAFRSRIAHHIDFPDYSEAELLSIAELMLNSIIGSRRRRATRLCATSRCARPSRCFPTPARSATRLTACGCARPAGSSPISTGY